MKHGRKKSWKKVRIFFENARILRELIRQNLKMTYIVQSSMYILLKKKLFLLSFVSLFQYLYVCKFKIEFAKYCKTGNIKWIFYSWLCFLNYTISHKVSDIAKIHDIISLFKTVRKHLFHQIFWGDFGSFF